MSPLLLLMVALAHADPISPLCFDFSKPVLKPLREPIEFSGGEDKTTSGDDPSGGGWASARGHIPVPVTRVLELLRDQSTLKNTKDCDLSYEHRKKPGYLDFEDVDITIHPFPLISVRWQEQWAYEILEGNPAKPGHVLISYQKVSGTDHIRKFCGNISLTPVDAFTTDIAIYEETDATRRTAEGIAKGHLGTLRTLRERATAAVVVSKP
jgi:hypothetical protein